MQNGDMNNVLSSVQKKKKKRIAMDMESITRATDFMALLSLFY